MLILAAMYGAGSGRLRHIYYSWRPDGDLDPNINNYKVFGSGVAMGKGDSAGLPKATTAHIPSSCRTLTKGEELYNTTGCLLVAVTQKKGTKIRALSHPMDVFVCVLILNLS